MPIVQFANQLGRILSRFVILTSQIVSNPFRAARVALEIEVAIVSNKTPVKWWNAKRTFQADE